MAQVGATHAGGFVETTIMAGKKKRKGIGKKTRFEVFKRDKFTCQYCGRKAPDITLELDHIKPHSNGGTDNILNLITSCFECNRGKRDIPLDKLDELDKKRKQLEGLQDRREQIEMMIEWEEGLRNIESIETDKLQEIWEEGTGYSWSKKGKKTINRLLKKYSYSLVLESIEIAIDTYYRVEEDEDYQKTIIEYTFKKIGGICFNKHQCQINPEYNELTKLSSAASCKFSYYNWGYGLTLLKNARPYVKNISELKEFINKANNWSEFKADIKGFIEYCGENNATD